MSTSDISDGIPLGPFLLQRPIGKGGMAEVWEGVHQRQQIPVAVKVITAQQARKEQFLDAFRNEVYAVAGLDHPGVVMVFDYGEVDLHAERLSRGRMIAGSPYLAMELATGGSLFHLREAPHWPRLREILGLLLEALGHAHARGVIHRDLKPGNVLLTGPGDLRPGLKLTDFGLAHALDPERQRGGMGHTAGTPQYMAPEQFEGRWRDFGPWTDLYALGCMTFELASGLRPFDGEGFWEIHRAHVEGPPPFEARRPLPEGFTAWLTRLLAWAPGERFQSAADALWGLQQLDGAAASLETTDERVAHPYLAPDRLPQAATISYPNDWRGAAPPSPGGGKLPSSAFFGFEGAEDEGATPQAPSKGVDLAQIDPSTPVAPPLARSWRSPSPSPPPRLVGAGLALYGIRALPLVGRDQERDALWEALLDARRSSTARLVMLDGAEGCGKSRLAGWICERAHELGGATSLRASWSRLGGPQEGLEAMLARHLRCEGLSPPEVAERCRRLLAAQGVEDRYEWTALASLLCAEDASLEPRVTFTDPMQRFVLVRRLLERAALQRPVILWLDDAHWSSDALAFVDYLLKVQRHSPCALLLVMTTQEQELGREDRHRLTLEALRRHPRATALPIGPLLAEEHQALLGSLLSLEPALIQQLVARAGGTPLFSLQLLRDWVRRGLLEVTEGGFTLRPGASVTIPDDLHQLWCQRVERFLADQPPQARVALELCAALGPRVALGEWRQAADALRLRLPRGLPEATAAAGLASLHQEHWRLAHALLRESLERAAREQDRWRHLHRACAQMLESRYKDMPQVAARLGNHYLQAGQARQALGPLRRGAEWCTARGEYARAARLVALSRQILQELRVERSDARWGELVLLEILGLTEQGRTPEAEARCAQAEVMARKHRWRALQPELHRLHAHALRKRGDLRGAAKLFLKAHDGFEAQGEGLKLAGCLRGLGFVFSQMGDLDRAWRLSARAVELYEAQKDLLGVAESRQLLAMLHRKRDELEAAEAQAREALTLHTRAGYLLGQASCYNTIGEIARYRGAWEDAARAYQQSIALYERVGSTDAAVPRLNLGLTLLGRGEWRGALRELRGLQRELEAQEREGLQAAAAWATLPALAWLGEMAAWDEVFAEARASLARLHMVDPDLAWLARLSAQVLSQQGQAARAQRSEQAARALWGVALDSSAQLPARPQVAQDTVEIQHISVPIALQELERRAQGE